MNGQLKAGPSLFLFHRGMWLTSGILPFPVYQVLSLLLCGRQEAAAINLKPFSLELLFKFVYNFCAVTMLNSTCLHMLLL